MVLLILPICLSLPQSFPGEHKSLRLSYPVEAVLHPYNECPGISLGMLSSNFHSEVGLATISGYVQSSQKQHPFLVE